MSITERDWDRLATLFRTQCGSDVCDCSPYPGYRPETVEAPNGDTRECELCKGKGEWREHDVAGLSCARECSRCSGSGRVPNVDAQKRYLHVAEKYLRACPGLEWPREYLARAHYEACRVAEALGVPAAYWPRPEHGALRVIDYPPGAGTVEHTDFDLFTVLLWRSTPEDLELYPKYDHTAEMVCEPNSVWLTRELSPGLHIGELGELVGLGPATPHRVPARPYAQRSIVYFALPDHAALLPLCAGTKKVPGYEGRIPEMRSNLTVGEWLAERMARSRVAAGGYK